MIGKKVKASAIRGALSPWRYDASLDRWIGGKARAFREFTADMVELTPGESVLDLGCGTGELTLVLSRRVGPNGRVAGIDRSKVLVAGARRRAKRAGLAIDYRVASIEHLPFGDATVDVVVSSLVMHHLAPDTLERAVGEIRRVLKPGGRVLIIDFQSLDQAGRDHHLAHRHDERGHHETVSASTKATHADARSSHQHGHGHHVRANPHEPRTHHGPLHDHHSSLVGLLNKAGLSDAEAIAVEFGQRLEVTRGRLTTG